MTDTDPISSPIACTLEAARRPKRRAEWEALMAQVQHRERLENGMLLVFRRGATTHADVADLVQRERECCAFFDFRIGTDEGNVVLQIEVPRQAMAAVDALVGGTGEDRWLLPAEQRERPRQHEGEPDGGGSLPPQQL